MPADRRDPPPGTTSLWLAAMWTALGVAIVGALAAIAVVAVVWLPASGNSGSATSAIRAGLLTFLASVHAGITVDGVPAAFLPLGLTVLTGLIAWRAGGALADTADDLDETDPRRLVQAAVLQAATFAVACAVLAATATLGTSSVPPVAAAVAAFVLFGVTGGVAFVRGTRLGEDVAVLAPPRLAPVARIAGAAVAVYLAAGAVLVAASVVVHHARVAELSREVGGGWSGVPILLLGVLAAPNAVIAGAGYLSGSGFAVGSGTGVGLTSTTHGVVPSFPVLGALPTGHGANLTTWLLAVLTPVLAGGCVAVLARRAGGPGEAWADAGYGTVAAGVIGAVLAWQGGGAIGSGRLHAVGASPWQFGVALTLGTGVVAAAVLGAGQALAALRAGERSAARVDRHPGSRTGTGPVGLVRSTLAAVHDAISTDKDSGEDDGGDSVGDSGEESGEDSVVESGGEIAGDSGRGGKLAG